MSLFSFKHLHLGNFRCFEKLDLALEEDLTVLFAENGGGKSAILNALAMGLAVIQRASPSNTRPNSAHDPRLVTLDERGRREPGGVCRIEWGADLGLEASVKWSTTINPASNNVKKEHRPILEAIERTRAAGARWPLFGWYGTDRMGRGKVRNREQLPTGDRWEGYASALDPSLDDGALLQWFTDEILSDAVRRREHQEERLLDAAVTEAMVRATPGVSRIWYEPRERGPRVRFDSGHVASWSELSDGFHVFLALVGDIARRAVILNENDRGAAPELAEGVVLIDEIDLHLHPQWQRIVLNGLRKAFPKLQFVVSTHSPQVLSSAQNRQVRRLINGQIQEHKVFVEGRDTNAILREQMGTDDRDEAGAQDLDRLHRAIDSGSREEAERIYKELLARWGNDDPALIRAKSLMDEGQ
jgi:predicted ATP-binding protein involved in virulence